MVQNTKRNTVIVADDDEISLMIFQSTLGEICNVVCTSDPLEVMQLCCTHMPSLILLDIEMPEMSGFELCAKLKSCLVTKDIPIIFCTSHTTVEFEQEALANGAVDFIPKPLHSGILALRVMNHLKIINQAQELKVTNYKLHADKEQLHVTLSSIGDAVIATNQDLNVTFMNPTAEKLTGWNSNEAEGRYIEEIMQLYDASSGHKMLNPLSVALREKRSVGMPLNAKLLGKTGAEYRVEDSASPIIDSNGKMIGGVIVFQDVTDAMTMATQMSHLANHDQLTGLPNRMLLHDRMQLSIAESSVNKEQVAILLIDIDNFKNLNDTLGHDAGDAIINHVARKLEEIAPVNTTVSRVGGDEFVILLSDIHYLTHAEKVAKDILKIANEQMLIQDKPVHLSMSIGISVFPHDASNPEELMRHADTAMYKVKGEGKNNYAYYSPYLTDELTGRVKLEELLRNVIEKNQVKVFFQPKIDMLSKRIVGAEALARIVDKEEKLIPPDEFIPVAEETGMIIKLGEQILLKSCQCAKNWLKEGQPCKVAVNIAAAQFNNSNFCYTVETILKQCDLPPHLLELEITESAIIDDFMMAQETLAKMKKMGVSVALDDFGTGYSSLSYLRSFELDVLKIDKSFVKDAIDDPQATNIVKAIITLAQSLHLELVCEGVETIQHEDLMKKLGCSHAQGYLYSRPIDAQNFWKYLLNANCSLEREFLAN